MPIRSASSWRPARLVAFVVAVAVALVWTVTRSGPLAPIDVTVTAAATGEVAPVLFGIGTIEARRTYLIGPTAAGRVARVFVDVGDLVEAGQLLAEMEPVELDARVASNEAALARGRSDVTGAEARARDARSRRALAEAEAHRALDLGTAGIVSQSVVDVARRERESADAQVTAADAAVASAQRDLARLEADVRALREQRANIRLTAPVRGLITARDAEPGSTVIAGQAVLRLHDPESLWVSVRLDQGRSAGVAVGLPAEIVRRAAPRDALRGRVARVEPVSDQVTEERLVKVAFDSRPADLSTGEMAEVTLSLPVVRDALVVPNASLRPRGLGMGVWVHDAGRLRFAAVTRGAEDLDGRVEILEGLARGDEVVVHSARELTDRSRIRVVAAVDGAGR